MKLLSISWAKVALLRTPFRIASLAIALAIAPVWLYASWSSVVNQSESTIQATSYKKVPERLTLAVKIYDDTDVNLQIYQRMTTSLVSANHTITENSSYELSYDTIFHTITYREKKPDMGKLTVGGDVEIELKLWSSTNESLFTGRKNRVVREGENSFEIQATLREQNNGKVVWRGSAIANVARTGASGAIPNMVDALVAALGRTVRLRNIRPY